MARFLSTFFRETKIKSQEVMEGDFWVVHWENHKMTIESLPWLTPYRENNVSTRVELCSKWYQWDQELHPLKGGDIREHTPCNKRKMQSKSKIVYLFCGGGNQWGITFIPKCAHRGACEAPDVWGPCDTVGGGFVVGVTFRALFFFARAEKVF